MILYSICKLFRLRARYLNIVSTMPYLLLFRLASFAPFVLTRTVCLLTISFSHLILPSGTGGIMMVNAAVLASFLPNQTSRCAKPEVRAKPNISSS